MFNKMMIKRLKISAFTLILSPFVLVNIINAQTSDLQIFEGLAEGLNNSQGSRTLTEDDANTEEDPVNSQFKRGNIDFTDSEYGYTGDRSFDSAPIPRDNAKPLEYFGYEYFQQAPSTFIQSTNVPVPSDYIIGPGDNFKIYLYGNFNKEFTAEVSREGLVFFPDLGPINVSGLTFSESEKVIKDIVANKMIGTDINITMGTLRSINVYVMGEAFQPGLYTVSSLSTLTNAIFASGGINTSGSLRNIQLKRDGEVISEFDFYDILLNGDISKDLRLQPMDVIFIPPAEKTVGIRGEVFRPGIYELKKQEVLSDLLKFSGNLKPKASGSIEITRIDKGKNGFNLIEVTNQDMQSGSLDLLSGDVVNIPLITNSLNDVVLVTGHFQQPGFYPWKEGLKISELLREERLLSMTDLNYILIMRKDGLSKHQFLQADLVEIIEDQSFEKDIILRNRDHIILLPKLLKPEQITTRMIQDEFILDENEQYKMVDEWNSLTYLRKSLMEEKVSLEEQNSLLTNSPGASNIYANTDQPLARYYEYSIYDYCTLPDEIAVQIIEGSGFRAKKSLPIEELEGIDTPAEIMALQKEVENERIKSESSESVQSVAKDITSICRKQLLDPFSRIIDREVNQNGEKDLIAVYGNVHFPGEYPLTSNMTLRDAIKASGGLKDATYESEIELSRSDTTDKKISVYNSTASYSDDASMNISLKARDIINLKEISTDIKTVKITGEVYFEGEYPITENQTLTEVIMRAGGFTEFADLRAANLQRKALKEAETRRLAEARGELKRKIVLSSQSGGLGQNSLSSSAIEQLTSLLVDDSTAQSALGRLVIDLEGIVTGNEDDIILEGGDTLHIPKTQQTVSVIGEVYVPNAHVYRSDFTLADYINLSGGTNSFADQGNVYLVKADGSIVSPSELDQNSFFRGKNSTIEQGDTVVVPLQVQPFSTIKATTEVTQIIYQMALAAAAVNSF